MEARTLVVRAAILVSAWVGVSVLATLTARRTLLRLPSNTLHYGHRRKVAWHENAFGLVLIGVGIVLLFLPGPGTVLIVAGLLACDFPGRYKVLRWMLGRPRVLTGVNAFRIRHGKIPLEAPNTFALRP